jgi:hypothetical protein
MTSIKSELAEIAAIDHTTLLSTATGDYGLTETGFVAKPFGRLVAEQLALARRMFGADIDIGPGSVLRRMIELSAVEHARTYAMLAAMVDDQTVPTARGRGLDRLGEELGLPRPFEVATGTVTLTFKGAMPAGRTSLNVPVGARMLTPGGHHVALTASVVLSEARREATVPVAAFFPGPEHDLDGSSPAQVLDTWHVLDDSLAGLLALQAARGDAAPEDVVEISHTSALTGGDRRWSDERYRQLLLRAPRSLWTREAVEVAASLVPGVRQVKVIDRYGGLDLDKPIFGNFNFGERVFGSERDIASPYLFTLLVAPTQAAVWQGPDGLAAMVAEAVEDLRPIGVFPDIREAIEIGVGVRADIVIDGVPLPSGSQATVNASAPAQALKARLMARVRSYIDGLPFGEAVSPAKVSWSLMNEPGVADVRDLRLTRYPQPPGAIDFRSTAAADAIEVLAWGASLTTGEDQIAAYVDVSDDLRII